MQRWRGREGDPVRPQGRTERRSRRGHHPGHRPGKVRADAPRDTRRTGYSLIKETPSTLPQKGEYGGAGGVEGSSPLTPCPAPGRRPAAHAGQQPQAKEEAKRLHKPPFSLSPHAPRRAGDPPPMPGSSRRPRKKTRINKNKKARHNRAFPAPACLSRKDAAGLSFFPFLRYHEGTYPIRKEPS